VFDALPTDPNIGNPLEIRLVNLGGNQVSFDMVTLDHTPIPEPIEIDIKPGSDPNCLNINGKGVIPVSINGSDEFDVFDVDVYSLAFAGLDVRVKINDTPQCRYEDWNGDGYTDLVCNFEDNPDNWSPDNGTATLAGELFDGTPIQGSDTICIAP